MWVKSENSNNIKPDAVEKSGTTIIVRKNFKLVEETDEVPTHYEYDEWQMTEDQYAVYQTFEEIVNEQSDALIELAGLIEEVANG